jgi:broad specificity phosphatase PhoE
MRCRWKTFFHSLCKTLIEFDDCLNNQNEMNLTINYEKEIESLESQSNNKRSLNVLIVTHGAFMREIFRYFIQELNLKYDFEKSLFAKSVKNASISCFLFELNLDSNINTCKEALELTDFKELINVKCLYLNKPKLED